MTLDALPEFLLTVFWDPLIFLGGLLVCLSLGIGLINAIGRILGKS